MPAHPWGRSESLPAGGKIRSLRRDNAHQSPVANERGRARSLSRTLQLITARAFLATRWRQVILRDRATIERYHAKRLHARVADVSGRRPFYRG